MQFNNIDIVKNKEKLSNYLNSKKAYLPIIKKFDGYFQFPRPLVKPFDSEYCTDFNSKNISKISTNNIKQINQGKFNILNKCFNSYQRNDKNIKLLKNESSFYLKDFFKKYSSSVYNQNALSKDNLLNIIDKDIVDYKEKHKFNFDKIKKHRVFSLNKIKKILLDNNNSRLVNGIKFNEPSKYINNLFNEVLNKFRHNDSNKKAQSLYLNCIKLKCNDKKQELANININISDKYPSSKLNKDNSFIKLLDSNINITTSNNSIDICETKDFKEKNNTIKSLSTKSILDNKKEIKSNDNNSNDKCMLFDYNKSIAKDKDGDSISYISRQTQNEKIYFKNNILNNKIKTKNIQFNTFNKEKNFIKGFVNVNTNLNKENFSLLIPNLNDKYTKSSSQVYKEDIDLLKKSNSLAFELEKQKIHYDLEQLKKKKIQKEYYNKIMISNK